jgi:tetrahydromethanopterin S-methyltransferase subunit G
MDRRTPNDVSLIDELNMNALMERIDEIDEKGK